MNNKGECTPQSIAVADEVAIEALLREFTEDQLRRWLSELDLAQTIRLHPRRYYPIYLNLLSVFRNRLPLQQIKKISLECCKASIWSHRAIHYYFEQIPRWPSSDIHRMMKIGFDRHQIETVNSLLGLGKGLIIACSRMGLYSFIPADLALHGYKISVPILERKYRTFSKELDNLRSLDWPDEGASSRGKGSTRARNISLYEVLNIEAPGALFNMAQALRRGELVLMYIDGNGGLDGPWGDKSRRIVDFLGFKLTVKDGTARLACLTRTPILPLIAVSENGLGKAILGQPIIPGPKADASQEEQFIGHTTQQLYSFIERCALAYPEQWESSASLHRWRRQGVEAPEPAESNLEEVTLEIKKLLEQGRTLRINEQDGVIALPEKETEIWLDVKTLRSVKSPDWARDVFRALSSRSGLDLSWVKKNGAASEPWPLLARLKLRQLIAIS